MTLFEHSGGGLFMTQFCGESVYKTAYRQGLPAMAVITVI